VDHADTLVQSQSVDLATYAVIAFLILIYITA
jgi:hypothetical protein